MRARRPHPNTLLHAVMAGLAATALGACGSAAVDGEIGATPFTRARAAFFGGPYIVIADEAIPCNQMGWVQRAYSEGTSADGRRDFAALQIGFENGTIEEGSFLAELPQGMRVDGLINADGTLEVHHSREGTIDITRVTDNVVEGTFSVAFGEGGVAGEFSAEACVNLRG